MCIANTRISLCKIITTVLQPILTQGKQEAFKDIYSYIQLFTEPPFAVPQIKPLKLTYTFTNLTFLPNEPQKTFTYICMSNQTYN